MQWRASSELVAALKGSFASKWGRSSAREAEGLLKSFIDALGEEITYEGELAAEIASLDAAIHAATVPADLHLLLGRYREVVSAHFARRHSVLALCSIVNDIHDRLVSKALSLARRRMDELGQGPPPLHAMIFCGDHARREGTLHSDNRYLLLHEEDGSRAYLLGRQTSAALKEAGLLDGDHRFWHGTLANWQALLSGTAGADEAQTPFAEAPDDLPESEWRVEALSDLAIFEGALPMASAAIEAAKATLLLERNSGRFMQLARRVFTMPLALGRFGRWRVERDGEHRGEVNLQHLGLDPLVMTVRILSVHSGVPSGGTIDRINALLEKGVLSVELSERLLKAYQCLMQFRILSEIRNGHGGAFCTVEELDLPDEERLRSALDTVLNLQKIGYQRLVGLG